MNEDRLNRLFLATAHAANLQDLLDSVRNDEVLSTIPDLARELSRIFAIEQDRCACIPDELMRLAKIHGGILRSVSLICNLVFRRHEIAQTELDLWKAAIRQSELSLEPDMSLIGLKEALILVREGKLDRALLVADSCLGRLSDATVGAYTDFVRHQHYAVKTDIYAQKGNYFLAKDCLDRALGIAAQWRLWVQLISDRQELGHLLWMSGQNEAALLAHQDKEAREYAVRADKYSWLIRCHNSAAKCAIDCKKTEVAQRELAQAQVLLEQHPQDSEVQLGYFLLFSGQVALQIGEVQGAIDKYNDALARFQAMEPPFHRGALEAKISLAEFALYERKYKLFFELLQKLLKEAEETGSLDARSRLLVLQAYLFISEDPPLRAAYEGTVERLHLINNPTLLLKALGFLYAYALEHLAERDQAFLLSRLRGLEDVLEKSCYDGLYRTYVTERYEQAIENRLSRFLAQEEGIVNPE